MPKQCVDLTGRVFGRLIVQNRVKAKTKGTWWLCLCECGVKFRATSSNLTGGSTQSCGCLRAELTKERRRHRPMEFINCVW